jgi:DNA modification methylase
VEIANPGNLIRAHVGRGHMGSNIAHENEAPYPERIPEFFIRSHCPPGGLVLDPFSGSATTVAAARKLGRVGVGADLRQSQCLLGKRRIAEIAPYLPGLIA